MHETRPSVLAGTWYAGDAETLAAAVDAHLTRASPLETIARTRPVALIVPHAGHRWSGDAAACAYRLLAGEAGAGIRRVILLGPSHYETFRGLSLLDTDAYTTPLGTVPLDRQVVRALLATPGVQTVARAHAEEHCLEIQLPFLQRVLPTGFQIVPLLVSHLSPQAWPEIAARLAPHVDDQTLIVASSDFTHYGARFGYLPFRDDIDQNLRRLDKGALVPILALDGEAFAAYREETDISVCGYQAIGILLALLRQPSLQERWGRDLCGRVLEYYRSADLTGDFDGSVSYAAVAFFPAADLLPGPLFPERLQTVRVAGDEAPAHSVAAETAAPSGAGPARVDPPEQAYLLALARHTLERVTAGESPPAPPPMPSGVSAERLHQENGVFVTLTRGERLRGCIGHIVGREPLVAGVIANAASAALRDPRFPPVRPDEVADLAIEISVLTPLERVASPEAIVIGRHGVVLEHSGHRAVFLPQVAPEQGWDRETMLNHLAAKAGLPPGAWREGATFEVFEAFVFSEEAHHRPE